MRPPHPKTDAGRRPPAAVLFVASVLLYSAAFAWRSPAAPYLSFIAFVPALALLERTKPGWAALEGALAGAAIFGIVCPWLGSYHVGAILFVLGLEATWFSVMFATLSAILRTRSRFSLTAAAFAWVVIEIGRSIGFLAFPYASLPYTLAYRRAALVLASAGGVPLVMLAIAGSNACFLAAVRRLRGPVLGRPAGIAARAAFGAFCVAATLLAGQAPAGGGLPAEAAIIASAEPADSPRDGSFRVALVQPAAGDQTGVSDYAEAFVSIAAMSERALEHRPDLVAWHETAIVPPIDWHLRHRPDRDTYGFVSDVHGFLQSYPAPVLIGNGYAPPDDRDRTTEYNSALLYDGGTVTGRYDKVKLVPFTEYFPFEDQLPGLTRWLTARFGYFWTPGTGPTLLESGRARFAAPICFEDSFAHYIASFDAPDFFILQTNDAWAKSASMQEQHLAMSIVRAAETASTILRVADTGTTTAIAPNGHVVARLPAFVPATLFVDVPLGTATTTLYESFGKHVDIAMACMALVLAALSVATRRKAFDVDNPRIV